MWCYIRFHIKFFDWVVLIHQFDEFFCLAFGNVIDIGANIKEIADEFFIASTSWDFSVRTFVKFLNESEILFFAIGVCLCSHGKILWALE